MKKYLSTLALAITAASCGLLEPKHEKPQPPVNVEFQLPENEPPPLRPPARPGFFGFDVTEETAIQDINGIVSQARRNEIRWADACDRFNSGEELAEFKRGFDKALNSLSTRNEVVRSVAIGSASCLFRYDKSDYGISDSEYRKLEDRTVLQIKRRPDGQLENISTRGRTLQGLTNTLRPILHADDIILAAFEGDQLTDAGGDTYYDIIEQEPYREDFLANEGVNIQQQFDDQTALMGGVNRSGVARGSRLIIDLESINGRLRYSEDSSNVQPDNINNNPFIFEAAAALRDGDVVRQLRSVNIFNAIAREYIFDAPNGAHFYRIEDALNNIAVSAVPPEVAFSGRHAALNIDGAIRNSMCMDCHDNAIPVWNDTVHDHVQANNFLSDEKTIATDYMDDVQLRQYQNRVRAAYAAFLSQVGIRAGDRDPTNARVLNPFRDDVTVEEAAAKLRLTPDQYLDCLNGTQVARQQLGSHLTGGTVSLADFKEGYPNAVEECNLLEDS